MCVFWDNNIEGSGLTQHYVSVREAARILGISRDGVRSLVRRQRLGVVRTPLGNLVSRTDIVRLTAAREKV